MLPLIGSLVSAGANLFGGLMGQQNQADINAQNIANQQAINTENINFQNQINQENIQNQENFAQEGVQWRVQDAQKAGINPLAALGAQTASFSNVVAPQASAGNGAQASNAFGTGISQAGQDIGRAIGATRTPEEQAVAISKTAIDLENGQLQNDLLKQQIMASNVATKIKAAGAPGATPKIEDPDQVTFNPSSNTYSSGPSRSKEGWSWDNPIAKEQYMLGTEVPQWFGYNLPAGLPKASSGYNNYRNPLTGNYYQGYDYLGAARRNYQAPGDAVFGGT